MAKPLIEHGFVMLPLDPFRENIYPEISADALYLYTILTILKQRYQKKDSTFFFRSDEELATDCRWPLCRLKKAKSELKNYPRLVKIFRGGWHYTDTGKSSKRQPTCYQLL